jgi:hypothetical protein
MHRSQTEPPGVLDWVFRGLVLLSPVLLGTLIYHYASGAGFGPNITPVEVRIIMGFVGGPFNMLISALILWRVPGNAVARLLALFSLSIMGWSFNYHQGTPDFEALPYMINYAFFLCAGFPSLAALPLIFPTGHVYPRRLKAWVIGLMSLIILLTLGWLVTTPTDAPPTAVQSPDGLIDALSPRGAILIQLADFLGNSLMALGIISMVFRYRQASLRERQQIKWVAWASGIQLLLVLINTGAHMVAGWDRTLAWTDYPTYVGGTLIFPLAIGAAILRYHLWDIDRIINRTLVYSIITGILAAVYLGGVALMQSAFVALTGQESPLAVVASTLAIAALFTPVRRRVQDVVDRRFFRRRYDAEKTVDQFARAVRDEVDIDCVRSELVRVVEETMQPAHLSLWIRPVSQSKEPR